MRTYYQQGQLLSPPVQLFQCAQLAMLGQLAQVMRHVERLGQVRIDHAAGSGVGGGRAIGLDGAASRYSVSGVHCGYC